MKTVIITGGNSGIGRECARQLAEKSCHMVLTGRDAVKGKESAMQVESIGGKAEFIVSDLSTLEGVRKFAAEITAKFKAIDAVIHCAGVLKINDSRTADDLHEVFAVNYFSRFHLTELLKGVLSASEAPRVIFLTAGVKLDSKIDFAVFPKYKPFPGMSALSSIQIANFHYAAFLAQTEAKFSVGVVNAGLVKTDIMRAMPFAMKMMFNLLSPFVTVKAEMPAANLAYGVFCSPWKHAVYWSKPGNTGLRKPLQLDKAVSEKVAALSKQLAGL